MNVLIIEDEPLAAEKLISMLKTYDKDISILDVCSSVESALRWFSLNEDPDLGFFDIQLGDGTSFDIFEKVNVNFPVIFTTAYDRFAIKAFKVNSVDYLLKPFENEDLTAALEKFKSIHYSRINAMGMKQTVESVVRALKPENSYRERFVITVGQHLKLVYISDIVCFYSEEKSTFILTNEGRTYYLHQSLNQIEEELDPKIFFRTSRKEILNFRFMGAIINYGRNRLKITIDVPGEKREIVVSKERVKTFRDWLEQSS
ncbi:LytTR family two component transcriptional regulator [Marinilabilia salmonicolor]|jgi:DNA-binding LytR/AlgR family response regulator|uniref:LytR/AlgR family response regulator transcription factor n=1 Tax=Marinilabilia salmonicolor TaxID=989 RepID=UPI000D0785B6|nr:LytTR family DNA-binding domain-containing protein [Marinilabilia salmonicolor]PRZ00052.1 LytTR family two component transcriptional regulator [Marinilabilia salmonicolor]